jgi:hypothetical protein
LEENKMSFVKIASTIGNRSIFSSVTYGRFEVSWIFELNGIVFLLGLQTDFTITNALFFALFISK